VLADQRDVLAPQLVLERERRRGDHRDPTGRDDRREVGEALAGAGRRLDDEVMRLAERCGDGLGEVALAGPVVAVEGAHAAIQHRERARRDHRRNLTGGGAAHGDARRHVPGGSARSR
jgi:hypothetical protein